jgi:hypothetical protein
MDCFEEIITTTIADGNTSSRHHLLGPVDNAIEIFADERNLQRWALVPSAFQHIGAQTFKASSTAAHDRFDTSGAWGIWNLGLSGICPWGALHD